MKRILIAAVLLAAACGAENDASGGGSAVEGDAPSAVFDDSIRATVTLLAQRHAQILRFDDDPTPPMGWLEPLQRFLGEHDIIFLGTSDNYWRVWGRRVEGRPVVFLVGAAGFADERGPLFQLLFFPIDCPGQRVRYYALRYSGNNPGTGPEREGEEWMSVARWRERVPADTDVLVAAPDSVPTFCSRLQEELSWR